MLRFNDPGLLSEEFMELFLKFLAELFLGLIVLIISIHKSVVDISTESSSAYGISSICLEVICTMTTKQSAIDLAQKNITIVPYRDLRTFELQCDAYFLSEYCSV